MAGGAPSKHRVQIWGPHQHPYKHNLAEFAYTNAALPGVNNLQDAMDWMMSVMYPLNQSAVPLKADLPTGDNAVVFTAGSPGVVTSTNTMYKSGDQVFFTQDNTLPAEINPSVTYYIQNRVGNDFNISTDSDGLNLIDFASAGVAPNTMNNVANAYRVVSDDGDGKAASYRWEKREGDVSFQWYKVYDMDWGKDEILASFLNITNDEYVFKKGKDDADKDGIALTGIEGGQHIYGGASFNTHLTLHANSGDDTGPNSGFVQFADQLRPTVDDFISLGEVVNRFCDLYLSNNAIIDTMTISTGSITDTTGAIDFADENLSTTGTLQAGDTTVTQLEVSNGSNIITVTETGINSANGVIDYGSNQLTGDANSFVITGALIINNGIGELAIDSVVSGTTGGISSYTNIDKFTFGGLEVVDVNQLTVTTNVDAGSMTIDDITIDNDKVYSSSSLELESVGITTINAPLTDILHDVQIGETLDVTGESQLGNVTVDANTISTISGALNIESFTGEINTVNLKPDTDNLRDLGTITKRYKDVFISNSIDNGTESMTMTELMKFNAASTGAVNGATLFYNTTSGKWEPSVPDTEVDHGSISGLADDDHTQYAKVSGRAGGQTLAGGTVGGQALTLTCNTGDNTGVVVQQSQLEPVTNASYSGGWIGYDVGSSSKYYKDYYMKGQFFGFRPENLTSLASANVVNEGRLVWHTTAKKAFFDVGGEFKAPIFEHGSTQTTAGADITVSQTNDYVVRLTAATSVAKVQIPPFASFKSLILINATGSLITIKNNFGGAGVEKILTGLNKDMTIKADGCVHLVYDNTSQCWRVAGGAGSGGGELAVSASVVSVSNAADISANVSNTTARQLIKVVGNGGPVDLSSTPFGSSFSADSDGYEVWVIGTDDDNTVTVSYNDVSFGCIGEFSSKVLGKGAVAKFVYVHSMGRFIYV